MADDAERIRTVAPVTSETFPTNEGLRILVAIDEGRMSVNRHGRYVIDGEERPDRKTREKLQGRGFIKHVYSFSSGSYWRLTPKGKDALRAVGLGVRGLDSPPNASVGPHGEGSE